MNTVQKSHKAGIWQRLLFWGIIVFAFFIRYIYLSDIPPGINQDEAMAAVDAWALSQYGTDRYGMQWPVHFQAWGYGQMSVLLSYCMIPFIKLFGFNTVAVRIPMVLASVAGVALVYLISCKIFSKNTALAVMAFTAINPWQFMQSRWSLDCNLFPHVFLLGFYLLLCGLEKRSCLYLSMVFFGLTFYCYGIAVYSVPVFLFVYAIWCLWKKVFSLKEILISVGIFMIVTLPEILTMFINMVGLPTINTPLFTIPFFPESVRSQDILLLNFSFEQLAKNALAVINQVFLQKPDSILNALPAFGPMYRISMPFMWLGTALFALRFLVSGIKVSDENTARQRTRDLALLGFFCMGLWAGLMTSEVNINRINIIFYPLIFFTVYGIQVVIQCLTKYSDMVLEYLAKKKVTIRWIFIAGVIAVYCIWGFRFFDQYFRSYSGYIHTLSSADFLTIMKEADEQENYDALYVTSNLGWQYTTEVPEILTQYSCKIDALYFQGLTNTTGGRVLRPYRERYNFVKLEEETAFHKDALYVIHQGDLDLIETACTDGYDIVLECGEFLAVDLK